MTKLRLVFMGTPQFAVPTLHALAAAGHDVCAVYSQPPRPSGRGHQLQPSAVHAAAERLGLPVRTPVSLKSAPSQDEFRALHADAAIVVAYGLLLPLSVLSAPRLGCFNLHASLLPRWRGAAPIHRAVMAGDRETGVMVMRMEEGLDTGPVLATYRTDIHEATTCGALHDDLSMQGAQLILQALAELASGRAHEVPQSPDGVTYARKITPAEAQIDWTRPAREVTAHIHGLSPSPGAWTMCGDTRLKILKVRVNEGSGKPGQVISPPLTIACGSGAISIEALQRAGRGVQAADEFMRGFALNVGQVLGQ